ncbi:MAG: hypothetical protein AAF986_02360, partial [Pseudomonadota bacterium]
MKEFEQALQRARSLVNAPDTAPADKKSSLDIGLDIGPDVGTTPPSPHEGDENPTIVGVTGKPFAPPTEISPTTHGFGDGLGDSSNLQQLDADMDQFKASFGADGQGGRNIDGAFRLLRTQVLASMKDRQGKILGITSAAPGAGKSFTSIHLAMACARRSEQQAVLADFDFRRPSIASYLGAVDFPSSLGYFRGDGPLEQFLTRNETGNLRYLLTDRSSELSAEYLASPKMADALNMLTAGPKDTIVVADLPPLIGCDD